MNLCKCGHSEELHHKSNSNTFIGECVEKLTDLIYCACEEFMPEPEIEINHDEGNKDLRIEANQPMQLLFYSSVGTLGRFFINESGKFDFEGDVTESAEAFIEDCKRLWLEPEPEGEFEKFWLNVEEAEMIEDVRAMRRRRQEHINNRNKTPEIEVKLPPISIEDYQNVIRATPKEIFDRINGKESEVYKPLYCANCGMDVKRGEREGQYYFACGCPDSPIEERGNYLITDDANEHIRRKQLKN